MSNLLWAKDQPLSKHYVLDDAYKMLKQDN